MLATRLRCVACDTAMEGRFERSPFCRLSPDQTSFVLTFLAARGNCRLVESRLGISYPTVRSRLAAVQRTLGVPDLGAGEEERTEVGDVLERLEDGEISVDEAIDELNA
jgi:hypothetical protein